MIRYSIMSNTSPTGKFSALIDGGVEISVIKDSCAKQFGFQPFQVPSIILKYGNDNKIILLGYHYPWISRQLHDD